MSVVSKMVTVLTGFGLSGSVAVAEGSYHGYETAPYTVERRVGAAELRLYAPHMLAEVTVRGDQSGAVGQGFRVLAGYIFGGNSASDAVAMTGPVAQRSSEQIAMTVPVVQGGQGDEWTISFMMPAQYTAETLPVPNDPAIRFVQTAPERQLVLTFSGFARSALLAEQTTALQAIAAGAGINLKAGPFYYFYDDPFTLPWNRRNEVAFVVD